ncbi:MAG: hypothetical protein J6P32_07365, partial [Stomatobaculum sp.]|nr:hypothetical protein [Stomatobaculum sp.]
VFRSFRQTSTTERNWEPTVATETPADIPVKKPTSSRAMVSQTLTRPQSVFPDEISHHQGVHAVVEILEQLPQHDRDGEQDQIPYDAAFREIYIAFF